MGSLVRTVQWERIATNIDIIVYREYNTPTEFVLWVRIVSFQFGQKATFVDTVV